MALITGFLGAIVFVLITWVILPILHATIWRNGRCFDPGVSLPSFSFLKRWDWHWTVDVFWLVVAFVLKWALFYPLAGSNFLWRKYILQRNIFW